VREQAKEGFKREQPLQKASSGDVITTKRMNQGAYQRCRHTEERGQQREVLVHAGLRGRRHDKSSVD
jgi:hypothetical protein